MLKRWFHYLMILGMMFQVLYPQNVAQAEEQNTYKKYLIGFKKDVDEDQFLKKKGVKTKDRKKLKHVNMMIAELKEEDVETLKAESEVTYIEEDVKVSIEAKSKRNKSQKASQSSSQSDYSQIIPWGIRDIGVEYALNEKEKGNNIDIAILDTGISPHADLKVVDGVSFVEDAQSYEDDHGHGTHVAGIIGALDSGYGIVGAASDADLYAVKVLDQNGQGSYSQVIEGIDWAIENKMDIISISFGGDVESQALHEIIKKANDKGILIVAAAGNNGNGEGSMLYPAKYPEVLSVGAVDKNHYIAAFSSTGDDLDLVAPGTQIFSTFSDGTYGVMSGTSMAAPHVTGAAATVWAKHKKWSNEDVKRRLYETATVKGQREDNDSASVTEAVYGYRLVNVAKALDIIDGPVPSNSDEAKPPIPAPKPKHGVKKMPFRPDHPRLPDPEPLPPNNSVTVTQEVYVTREPVGSDAPYAPSLWVISSSENTATLGWTGDGGYYVLTKWSDYSGEWEPIYRGWNNYYEDTSVTQDTYTYYQVASWNGSWSPFSFNGGYLVNYQSSQYTGPQAYFVVDSTSSGNTLYVIGGSYYSYYKWVNDDWVELYSGTDNVYVDANVSPNEENFYFVWVWEEGQWVGTNGDGHVSVYSPPAKPGNFKAKSTETKITLTWEPVSGEPLTDPVINYHILVDGVEVGTTTSTSFELTNLNPRTRYTVSVYADNSLWARSDFNTIKVKLTGNLQYVYNAQNQLQAIMENGVVTVEFIYDENGNLISKILK